METSAREIICCWLRFYQRLRHVCDRLASVRVALAFHGIDRVAAVGLHDCIRLPSVPQHRSAPMQCIRHTRRHTHRSRRRCCELHIVWMHISRRKGKAGDEGLLSYVSSSLLPQDGTAMPPSTLSSDIAHMIPSAKPISGR
jgi:hypothetical protein